MGFTLHFIKFIKENYPLLGCKECAKLLNLSNGAVHWQAQNMKLLVSKETKSNLAKEGHKKRKKKTSEQYKVNSALFVKDFIPESVYILGMLWADGYVHKKNNSLNIEILFEYPNF